MAIWLTINFGKENKDSWVNYDTDFENRINGDIARENWGDLCGVAAKDVATIGMLDKYLSSNLIRQDWVSLRYHPIREGRTDTFLDLYSAEVANDNLKWANIMGEKFPYVVTNSEKLNNVGSSMGGLYFVAKDFIKEEWQELAVAFHERFCANVSHKYALQKEKEFASSIGKTNEHKFWRGETLERLKKMIPEVRKA